MNTDKLKEIKEIEDFFENSKGDDGGVPVKLYYESRQLDMCTKINGIWQNPYVLDVTNQNTGKKITLYPTGTGTI